MRVRSRWVLGVCGLAMSATAGSSATAQVATPSAPMPNAAAPGAMIPLEQAEEGKPSMPPGLAGMPPAWGGPLTGNAYTPGSRPGQAAPAPAPAPSAAPAAVAEASGHHHHGLFGSRHCVECQRARVKKTDGVDIPPPPGYPGGMPMAAGETIVEGPVVMGGPSAPGYAVVGAASEPGYASTDAPTPTAEPAPIGLARSSMGGAPVDPRMAANMAMPRRAPGSYDPSVMATSVPGPPSPMGGPGHNRPHIISHMLRPSMYLMHHRDRSDRAREKHAAEAYGTSAQPVTELPASAVYGRR